jgi:hypothetical protein
MTRRMSYDPECYRLAKLFLPDDAAASRVDELAREIQRAIEDWLAFHDDDSAKD